MQNICKFLIILVAFVLGSLPSYAAEKVVVLNALSDDPIVYKGSSPIVIDNINNVITFDQPAFETAHDNMQPSLVVGCYIAVTGLFPSGIDPFIGEIMFAGFNFAPSGWMQCDGQLLSTTNYAALFSLLGNQYGGNGTSTFALPDMRGRVPVDNGSGAGLTHRIIGQKLGSE